MDECYMDLSLIKKAGDSYGQGKSFRQRCYKQGAPIGAVLHQKIFTLNDMGRKEGDNRSHNMAPCL